MKLFQEKESSFQSQAVPTYLLPFSRHVESVAGKETLVLAEATTKNFCQNCKICLVETCQIHMAKGPCTIYRTVIWNTAMAG